MTDDGYDSKNKKKLPAYVRIYVRRKVFYTLSVISVIRHQEKIRNSNRRNSKKQRKVSCVRAHVRVKYFYKNYCYYCYCYQEVYEKQVHPFDETGACIWVIRCTHLGKQVHPFWRYFYGEVHVNVNKVKKLWQTIVRLKKVNSDSLYIFSLFCCCLFIFFVLLLQTVTIYEQTKLRLIDNI